MDPYSPEMLHEIMRNEPKAFVEILNRNIVPELKRLLTDLETAVPCSQLQLAMMDVISIQEHLADFLQNGPSPRFREIPLEASQVDETFEFPEDLPPPFEHTESGHVIQVDA